MPDQELTSKEETRLKVLLIVLLIGEIYNFIAALCNAYSFLLRQKRYRNKFITLIYINAFVAIISYTVAIILYFIEP